LKHLVDDVLLPHEVDEVAIRDEIWSDLSEIYYKYDDNRQKRLFREILTEIAEKINEDKWGTFYRKIYKTKKREKELQ
jgi:hypothetical protein